MKLGNSNTAPITTGVTNTASFSIAMNGKAFRVLSDSIYSNKIGSIVREYSCNALDSHVMAGTPEVPFHVHLPSVDEPWFSVRDFGVGLSPDAINTVFTTYFQSTKDNDNNAIGAFGLGSKTGFSYTDQFTVTSVYNGVRRVYSAYITETGAPSISMLDESETSDGNGVEISINVKANDYSRFAAELQTQLRFFKVKPKVFNAYSFKWLADDANEIVFENSDITLFRTGSIGRNLVQGQVGYVINTQQLVAKLRDMGKADLANFYNTLSDYPHNLSFSIGEIGVTASREAVEYNDHTMNNIVTKLNAVKLAMQQYVNDSLKAYNTDFDKIAFINKSPLIARLAGAANMKFDNASYSQYSSTFTYNIHGLALDDDTTVAGGGRSTFFEWVSFDAHNLRTRQRSRLSTFTPDANRRVAFFIKDTSHKAVSRIEHWLSKHGNDVSTVVVMTVGSSPNASLDNAFVKKMKAYFGNCNQDFVFFVSKLEMPPKVEVDPKQKKRYGRFFGYIAPNTTVTNSRECVKIESPLKDDIDAWSEGGVVIKLVEGSTIIQNTSALTTLRSLKNAGLITDIPTIYVMRPIDAELVKDNPAFVDIQSYVDKQVNSAKVNPVVVKLIETQLRYFAMRESFSGTHVEFCKQFGKLIDDKEYVNMALEKVAVDTEYSANRPKIEFAMGIFADVNVVFASLRERIEKRYAGVANRYSLVEYAYSSWNSKNVGPELVEYVNNKFHANSKLNSVIAAA